MAKIMNIGTIESDASQISVRCTEEQHQIACSSVMAIRIVEFSNGGYKIRKIFALNFENWTNREPQYLQKSEILKLIISFFQYFWCQN